jgi:phosphonate transport system substrate-binding protein
MRFVLPPSPSIEIARRRGAILKRALFDEGVDVDVDVAADYDALGDEVASGRATVGWVPPIVGARVEMAGGRILRRAIRGGSSVYRAGIVCRKGEVFKAENASTMTAAWVDEDSAAGYLLARSWLANRRVDAITGFRRALFTHSYVSALQAVADGSADIASIFASVPPAPERSTLDEVDVNLRERLEVVAHTGDTQTDGIGCGQSVDMAEVQAIVDALDRVVAGPGGQALLQEIIQAEGLIVAPARPTSTSLAVLLSSRI